MNQTTVKRRLIIKFYIYKKKNSVHIITTQFVNELTENLVSWTFVYVEKLLLWWTKSFRITFAALKEKVNFFFLMSSRSNVNKIYLKGTEISVGVKIWYELIALKMNKKKRRKYESDFVIGIWAIDRKLKLGE